MRNCGSARPATLSPMSVGDHGAERLAGGPQSVEADRGGRRGSTGCGYRRASRGHGFRTLVQVFSSRRVSVFDQGPLAVGNSSFRYVSSISDKVVRFGLLAASPDLATGSAIGRIDCAQSPRFCPWAAIPLFWSGRGRLSLIRLYQYADRWLVLLIAGTLDQRNWGQCEPFFCH